MKNLKLYILGFFFCVNFFIWYAVFAEKRNFLTVAFLNVGQGDAIFIEAPDGRQILIDGGSNGKVLRELGKVMPFYDRSIDIVIMSHPDSDHIGGLPAVLENYKVGMVLEPGSTSHNGVYQEMERLIKEKHIKRILARQGMDIVLDKNVNFSILFPDRDPVNFDTNVSSIVARLDYGEKSFLFTGDSPQGVEKYLVGLYGDKLKVNVLKLGHHGSKSSSSETFLTHTNPQYAIISVGKNNRYGHPHQEVLDLLKRLDVKFFRTDEEGTIIFKSNGYQLSVFSEIKRNGL